MLRDYVISHLFGKITNTYNLVTDTFLYNDALVLHSGEQWFTMVTQT